MKAAFAQYDVDVELPDLELTMISELSIQFEWDFEKEKSNIAKHKMNFTDACHVFSDPFQLNVFDCSHSEDEDRWVVIGEIPVIKIVVVIHTFRNACSSHDVRVRIISASKATRKEQADYFARRPR